MKRHAALSKRRAIKHWLIFALCIVLSVSFMTGCASGLFRKTYSAVEVFYQAATLIDRNYVNPSGTAIKLDTSMAPDISTLTAQLDSSTFYWTKEDVALRNAVSKNASGGATGVDVENINGSLCIKRVVFNSPAYLAGIRLNDKVEEINGESVEGLSEMKLLSKLQGEVDSEVLVKIEMPNGEKKVVKIIRQVINQSPNVASKLIVKKIGYIRIVGFPEQTGSAVKADIKKLLKQDMQALIVDLRGNGGGLFDSVTEAVELFLPRDTPIAHLVTKNRGDEKTFEAEWNSYYAFPMVVMIDKNTSSGAELFAAVLKEAKRAVLIGETTMGNGTIRTVFTLKDGSLLGIRTAYMQTGTGNAIEGHGVKPDVEVVLSKAETEKLYDKLEAAAIQNNVEISDDVQLETAVASLADRITTEGRK